MDSGRVGCVTASRLGSIAVHERFKRRVCCCGAIPMLTKLRTLLGLWHQTAQQERPQKTLEAVLSNSIPMKAEVDFMYATKLR